MIFSAWCDIATEAVCADAPMMAVFPQTTNPQAWFRAHLESYRPVFCGSPQDQNNADAARRVGFAHISAHVLPSWYVGLYNLLFSAYHAIADLPAHPDLPSVLTVRRRWLHDIRITLDTYDVALTLQIQTLHDISLTDPLTALFNRRGFWTRIQLDIDQGITSAAFVLIDLDRFKSINDSSGHIYGDQVLRSFGSCQQTLTRTGDTVGRLGGDEFSWWVVDIAAFSPLHERLQMLAATCRREAHVNFSAGVAWYPQDGETPELLYHAADKALYHAKESGRSCCALANNPTVYPFSDSTGSSP